MGRGRVQLRRIENKIHRQVTFSKRRLGLLKKAHEISVLCGVEVALIIFSTNGKLHQYPSDSSMETILQRYERHSYFGRVHDQTNLQSKGSPCLESKRLQAKVEDIQRNLSHLSGKDLDTLKIKQLLQLEKQLEDALRLVRSRKAEVLSNMIDNLQREEKSLREKISMMDKMHDDKAHQTHQETTQTQMMNRLKNDSKQHDDKAHQTHQETTQTQILLSVPLPDPSLHVSMHRPREMGSEAEDRGRTTNSILPHWMPRQQ